MAFNAKTMDPYKSQEGIILAVCLPGFRGAPTLPASVTRTGNSALHLVLVSSHERLGKHAGWSKGSQPKEADAKVTEAMCLSPFLPLII